MNIESGVSTIKVKRYKDIVSPKKDIVPNKESVKMWEKCERYPIIFHCTLQTLQRLKHIVEFQG